MDSFRRRPKQPQGDVFVYDRGGTLALVAPLKNVQKYVDQEWTRTVRARDGRVLRIYWLSPNEPPAVEHGFHKGGNPLNRFSGTRYVFLEKIWPDVPYKVFTLVESRFMPPEMMQAVPLSVSI